MKFCGSSKYLPSVHYQNQDIPDVLYNTIVIRLEASAQPVNTQLCGTMMPLHCFTVWPVQICAKSAMTKNLV